MLHRHRRRKRGRKKAAKRKRQYELNLQWRNGRPWLKHTDGIMKCIICAAAYEQKNSLETGCIRRAAKACVWNA
jgi:hypothetical protein